MSGAVGSILKTGWYRNSINREWCGTIPAQDFLKVVLTAQLSSLL